MAERCNEPMEPHDPERCALPAGHGGNWHAGPHWSWPTELATLRATIARQAAEIERAREALKVAEFAGKCAILVLGDPDEGTAEERIETYRAETRQHWLPAIRAALAPALSKEPT